MLYGPNGHPARQDALSNVLTGLGTTADKSEHAYYRRSRSLDPAQLDALYEQQGIAARVVDLPADEMTREGFDLEDLPAGVALDDVTSGIEDLELLRQVADLNRWGDHFGGALLVMGIDDGQPSELPVDFGAIRAVTGLAVVDRWCCEPVIRKVAKEPEAYVLHGYVDAPIEGRVVHASRVIKHVGIAPSPRRKIDMRWWGVPRLERVWSELRRMLAAHGYGESVLHDCSIDVFAINGLFDSILAGQDDLIAKRLRNIQLGKSVMRAVTLDAGGEGDRKPETYIPTSRNVSGIAELIDIFVRAYVIGTGIPRSKLIGETPSGLNSGSNAGETRSFYDDLAAVQKTRLTPWVNRVLEVLFAAKEGPTGGRRPPVWNVRWRPLWAPTELERQQARVARAQADALYIQAGAISAETVYDNRFVRGVEGELVADKPFELPSIGEGLGE